MNLNSIPCNTSNPMFRYYSVFDDNYQFLLSLSPCVKHGINEAYSQRYSCAAKFNISKARCLLINTPFIHHPVVCLMVTVTQTKTLGIVFIIFQKQTIKHILMISCFKIFHSSFPPFPLSLLLCPNPQINDHYVAMERPCF